MVQIEELSSKDVKNEVLQVLSELSALFNSTAEICHSYFLRFSDEELAEFSEMVNSQEKVTQEISSHSLVFTDGKDYWKRIIDVKEIFMVC